MPTTRKKSPPRVSSTKTPPPLGRTVLVAVSGLSPGVLTETIWKLARESPAVIPDQIIVLTTERGRTEIATQLFGDDDQVWLQLRATLLGPKHENDPRLSFDLTPDRVKVIHKREGARRMPLIDLATQEDNKAIADALVDELWTHTSKPDTRVIASLAGGYKTMSALCLSAMQLLAAPGDRVTHVLVGGGFDQTKPQTPRFFFPEQPNQNLAGPKGPLKASDATDLIQLIDVPVIPLRNWFEQLLHAKPPSYDVLLSEGAAALARVQTADLRLELGPVFPADAEKHHAVINGVRIDLSSHRYAYLRFFAERRARNEPKFAGVGDVLDALEAWLRPLGRDDGSPFSAIASTFATSEKTGRRAMTQDDFPKRIRDLEVFLAKACDAGERLTVLMPGKGRWYLQLPAAAITLR